MEGERFVRHDHATAQEARHMEKESGAVLVHVVQRLTDVPGHPLAIIVEQDDVAILSRTHGDTELTQQTRCVR